ncbi:XtrA/YqaO family protein [Bacillus horti]|uniref:Uncharacterized protein n=1 Tax=Caldalkalibacillus horti TaxID=77523 RepID=A0ABT9VV29_9BACI|nr:XtrA/YqaO family protein [Bacillus horti]MDQ0164847.1 hypothetical protein [Bacillus horti]
MSNEWVKTDKVEIEVTQHSKAVMIRQGKVKEVELPEHGTFVIKTSQGKNPEVRKSRRRVVLIIEKVQCAPGAKWLIGFGYRYCKTNT